jgi:hypothetical protein
VRVELLGAGHLEGHPAADAGVLCPPAGRVDRGRVVVGPEEGAAGEGLRHQQRGGAVAAAEVRDRRPLLELLLHPVERGDPLAGQVHQVAGPEEALAAGEHVRVVLVPSHAGPGAERVLDPALCP